MKEHPKVFISYCHIDESFEAKMLEFANRLRRDGIDANIDLFEESPKEGWSRWMENQIRISDYVLVVCNKEYAERFYNTHGKGVTWEVQIIYQVLNDNKCENEKFIPVFWNDGDDEHILIPLKPYTYYNLSTEDGYKALWRRLLGIKKYAKAELGEIDPNKYDTPKSTPLPEKEQRVMFFTTPIDLELWNKAKWKGMVYLLPNPLYPCGPTVPTLGFMYTDYDAAVKIFKGFRRTYKGTSADMYMDLTFVIPPLPKDCYVNCDPNYNYGKGYFVYLGPNYDEAAKRVISIDGTLSEKFITGISRYIWVDELNGSTYREMFRKLVETKSEYRIIPVGMKDKRKGATQDNLILGDEYSITLHRVRFINGIDIDENDPCKVVLKPSMSIEEGLDEVKNGIDRFLKNAPDV